MHRDIKPGNIVPLKGTDTIKVTHFGIAHGKAPDGSQRGAGFKRTTGSGVAFCPVLRADNPQEIRAGYDCHLTS